MHVTAVRKSALVCVIGCACVLLASASASAERAGSSSSTGSSSSKGIERPHQAIAAQVKINYSSTGKGGGGSGPLASTDSSWTPPPCWYAPEWSATEFQQFRQGVYVSAVHDPDLPNDVRGEISDENQKYAGDNYNIDKEKEGMWWGPQYNDDAPLADQMKCDKDPFWVKKGRPLTSRRPLSPRRWPGSPTSRCRFPEPGSVLPRRGRAR